MCGRKTITLPDVNSYSPTVKYCFLFHSDVGEHTYIIFTNKLSIIEMRIFGPKREVDGSWRKLNNDELHNLYYSPAIVRVIKARKLRWAGHVARMEEGRGVYREARM
jgi:hypothetical protein